MQSSWILLGVNITYTCSNINLTEPVGAKAGNADGSSARKTGSAYQHTLAVIFTKTILNVNLIEFFCDIDVVCKISAMNIEEIIFLHMLMMPCRMVLSKIISHIFYAFFPINVELVLLDLVLNPIKSHVNSY